MTDREALVTAALDLVAQGIPVFPCLAANRAPACERGFYAATTDPARVRELFAIPGAALIGVPTGEPSGFDALDIDPRHDGDKWFDANAARMPVTRIHTSQRGGMHLLFRRRPGLRCSTSDVAPGVDIRAEGGYIVWWPAEGIPLALDWEMGDLAEWPEWALPAERDDGPRVTATELVGDLVDIASAMRVIPNDNPNTNWDWWNVRGMALWAATEGSEEGREVWHEWSAKHPKYDEAAANERWDHYPTSEPDRGGAGSIIHWAREADPTWVRPSVAPTGGAEFDALPAPPVEGFQLRPFVWRDPATFPRREWLYGRHYIRQYLSATLAPGGLGKSSNALVEALDMVTGRGLLTGKPTDKRLRVWYHCGEDPLEEIERRVAAICLFYRITESDIGGRLFLNSGRDSKVCVATESRGDLQIAVPLVDQMVREFRARRVDVAILDPFVSTHRVSENDNGRIEAVCDQFKRVSEEAECAVELIHHTRKGGSGMAGQDMTADDGRGAGALIAAARSVRVLNRMQQAEADSLGIPDDERRRYFRTDADKTNMAPPGGKGVWRYLASQSIGNAGDDAPADEVGVVTSWEKPAAGDGVTAEHVAEIRKELDDGAADRRDVRAEQWVGRTVAGVMGLGANSASERKRLTAIVDTLIDMGVLETGRQSNGKGRAVEIVKAAVHYDPQLFNCGIPTVVTVGNHHAATPHTSSCGGVGVCVGSSAAHSQIIVDRGVAA